MRHILLRLLLNPWTGYSDLALILIFALGHQLDPFSFDLPALCPGPSFFLAFLPWGTAKASSTCLSGDFTMTCKDLSYGNKLMPHLPNFFLCGAGEEEVGKVGKEENSTVESRRFNESVDFGFLGGGRVFGHVVQLVGS